MKRKIVGLLAVVVMTSVFTGCLEMQKCDPYGLSGKTHAAVTPVDRKDDWWVKRHQQVLDRVAQGNVDLICVGDSITHGWEGDGKALWEQYYAPRNAVNMGFGGDQTQHVLWRFEHGEIDGISPKLAVLMIGTNNSNGNDNTAEEIADGIKAICAQMRAKLPKTKILILAIFPRGEGPSPQREKNAKAGELA
jgi:beta-glucosidase